MKKFIYSLGLAVFTLLMVAGLVQAASTIGTNISTAGTLSVTGATTMTAGLTVDTNTLKVDAANNYVGIGTTTPKSILSVSTSVQLPPATKLLTVASTTGSTLFNILANGNVGIGTLNPLAKLDIVGATTGGLHNQGLVVGSFSSDDNQASINVQSTVTGSVTWAIGLDFDTVVTPGTSVQNRVGIYIGDVDNGVGVVNNNYGIFIETQDNATNNYGLYSNGHEITYLRGNVGIGDNNPAARLLVKSDGHSTGINFQAKDVLGNTLLTIIDNGNITADSNTFVLDADNNRLGVGTSSPKALFSVGTSGSSTIDIKNACFQTNSPNGTRYHFSISNSGSWNITPGNCP